MAKSFQGIYNYAIIFFISFFFEKDIIYKFYYVTISTIKMKIITTKI
jgi:hypothetical protein